MNTIHRSLAFSVLAFGLTCLSGCAVLYGPGCDALVMPFLAATKDDSASDEWVIADHARSSFQGAILWTHPDQTEQSDRIEQIEGQQYARLVGLPSIEAMLASVRSGVAAQCSDAMLEVIREEPQDVLYELRTTDCAVGPDEYQLVRVMESPWTRFLVTYTYRGDPTMWPEQRTEWIEKLLAARVAVGVNVCSLGN